MAYDLRFETLPKDPKLEESFDVFICNGFSLPSFAIKFLQEEAKSYEAREDDIYVVSYPKTGTTWLQEIVFIIHSNLDFNAAKTTDLHQRFPYIEHAKTNYNYVKNMESPRLLKTHLPFSLLPPDVHSKKCKMIYITRNPRDVAVSYYHFACMLKETRYKGTFKQFFERFLANRSTYSPFLQHNLEFWKHRNDENVLFLFYEDLQKDLPKNLKKISDFLGKPLTAEEIKAVVDHCSFKNMAKSESVGLSDEDVVDGQGSKFFRKGKVGDWKNYFNEEMISKLDQQVEHVLSGSGLEYTYEI
ncbi:sulfotransferase 1E1-like [Stegodyphus dumicola]|uniref:sulfotransferase 1E1-like n=1 Tax=Stegodyphus dumicola TaxID=202533 RepID=UPI0015A76C72|nr:sulfotransferase 1E1-like [Stegodyphus dumicola]